MRPGPSPCPILSRLQRPRSRGRPWTTTPGTWGDHSHHPTWSCDCPNRARSAGFDPADASRDRHPLNDVDRREIFRERAPRRHRAFDFHAAVGQPADQRVGIVVQHRCGDDQQAFVLPSEILDERVVLVKEGARLTGGAARWKVGATQLRRPPATTACCARVISTAFAGPLAASRTASFTCTAIPASAIRRACG